ncbi:unnamed protein product [Gordionus sp. m RMFG-2023]|uniref:AP-2 complex subunit alpha-2-like n=1 Tax=Gordionus sp. m RMFG-2023 TaxID=3053472 RepID=UPI0030E27AC2
MPAVMKLGGGNSSMGSSGATSALSSASASASSAAAAVLGSVVGGVAGAAGGVLSGAGANSDGMRGLATFIGDIRNCKSREAEIKRVNKELAHVRAKFAGDRTLDGYQKKKYVCKLLFAFLLGHDIDFGRMEAVNLLSSNKYTEKQIGYLFISVLISPHNELMKLVIQALKNDLSSKNPVFVCLALNCISNLGSSKEMAEAFGQDIPKILTTGDSSDSVKQSASLCLLKLLRSGHREHLVNMPEWAGRVVHLLNDQHLGVVTAACPLVNELVGLDPGAYKTCPNLAVSRLSRIVTASYTDLQDYTYYFVPAPWLCVQLLRLLQNWTGPGLEPATKVKLLECLDTVLLKATEPPKSKKVQHSNARNAVLFEAIDLVAHLYSSIETYAQDGDIGDEGEALSTSTTTSKSHHPITEASLIRRSCDILGRFLQHRETNLRFLALSALGSLVTVSSGSCGSRADPISAAVTRNRDHIVGALRGERDPSVRRGAADLLYASCGPNPADCEFVCSTLADYLTGEGCVAPADYGAREETVLKMAALAERYAKDRTWYLDTILNLIRMAGDHVSEEVWYRAVQIVVNHEDLQGYAAKAVFEALVRPPVTAKSQNPNDHNVVDYFYCHENLIKVGGYILGEFGNLIAGDPRSGPALQFAALHSKFHLCSNQTKALLLSTYVKFVNLFPEIKEEILQVLNSDSNIRSSDPEIQQRAVEYVQLCNVVSPDVLAVVLEEMPPFPENSSSASLLTRLIKDKKNTNNKKTSTTEDMATPKKHTRHPPQEHANDNLDLISVTSPSPSVARSVPGLVEMEAEGDVFARLFAPTQHKTKNDPIISAFKDAGENHHESTNNNITKDIYGGYSMDNREHPTISHTPLREILGRFALKNAGLLYEDSRLQIGAKIGQSAGGGKSSNQSVTVFYGNKSARYVLENFSVRAFFDSTGKDERKPEDLHNTGSLTNGGLSSFSKPAVASIDDCISLVSSALNIDKLGIGVQAQQNFSVINRVSPSADPTSEYFYRTPRLRVEFSIQTQNPSSSDPFTSSTLFNSDSNASNKSNIFSDNFNDFTGGGLNKQQGTKQWFMIDTYLPICINKFCDAQSPQTMMDQSGFFQRWKTLVNPGQEYQKVFKASFPIDAQANRDKITNFGLTVLIGIDSNEDNIVATGIINTESQPIGCLLRLEPNRKSSMYRLTIRSTRPAVSKELGFLLTETNLF